MKRGPRHFKKTVECNSSSAQVALGIPEIVANILHQYPRYGLRGQNNLVTVSKVWHEAIKQCHLQDEPTFEKLIADCLKCPESVIQILRDDTFLPYLSEEQILKLISCHSEFAIYLLKNDFIPINQENLLILTKHHPQVAMHLFTNPKWRQTLQQMNIYLFGCQHLEIAQYILDNHLGSDLLHRREGLKTLAESSPIIARRIFNDPATYRDLTEHNLNGPKFLFKYIELLIERSNAERSKANQPSVLLQINTPEDFINHFEDLSELELSRLEVKVLGEYHSEIAMKVMQSERLFKKYCETRPYNTWVINHEAVAMCFIKTEAFREFFDYYLMSRLCENHPAALEFLFNQEDLRINMYANVFLNSDSPNLPLDKIAMPCLKDPNFRRISHDSLLVSLGTHNPEAAKFILTTKELYTKLSENSVRLICNKYPHITQQILNTQSLRELVKPAHLAILEAVIIEPFAVEISKQAKGWDLQSNKPSKEMDVDAVAKFTLKK
ncbi:hypothetical protein [Candidatus Berkiella aquae]|uniref:Uncharacterized protein n=1 Tax=Candidatus Berkiella aquae TaxID=295108 RepID=A0A0Q9YKH4_9GAMM|nr:hypothetical protein [Candidatus Berkiella aquae]MCS5711106.1 hypothetical protein [Candidatus Berkiella aquae]